MPSETIIFPLSKRETEVLNYVGKGFSNKRIAFALDISEDTVKNHMTSIMHKLNASNRTHAVMLATTIGKTS